MSLRDAVVDFRERAKVLEARLKALSRHAEKVGGGSVHALVEQVDKAAVDALGWVKKVRAAVNRAVKAGANVEVVRAALVDAQARLDKLRVREPRRLRGRALVFDLADLQSRHEGARELEKRRLGAWAQETSRLVRAAGAAASAADEAMAACWRELATRPGGRVRVKTVTIVD
jgi:hypothetical protein